MLYQQIRLALRIALKNGELTKADIQPLQLVNTMADLAEQFTERYTHEQDFYIQGCLFLADADIDIILHNHGY